MHATSRPSKLGSCLALGLALVAMLTPACTRSLGRGPSAPGRLQAGDPRLAGTWVSTRTGQLGPSGMRFRFSCTGEYRARVRVLGGVLRLHESGEFWTAGSTLHLTRANGDQTSWSFQLDGEGLRLEEAAGEWHLYRRVADAHC